MLGKGDKVGDYILEKFLGRGQFGEVWMADKDLPFSTRKVRHALKFLVNQNEEIDLNSAAAEIDTWIEAGGHPNVMTVLDMLIHREHIIIISEFAEGGSLKSWLGQHRGKAPSDEKTLEMMAGILRGIIHLHSRNVVHRDLKPDNILLQGEFPRITDFGISRIVSEGTMSTNAVGSPAYMSPEAFMGNKSPQTDIWSAGVIMYEMLTGDFPYSHEMIYGLISAIQQDEPKPLPIEIPYEIRKIVETALQKDREKRYQTAQEMFAAVEAAILGVKIRASKDSFETLPRTNNNFSEAQRSNTKISTDNQQTNLQAIISQPPEIFEFSSTQPAEKLHFNNQSTDDRQISRTAEGEFEKTETEQNQSSLKEFDWETTSKQTIAQVEKKKTKIPAVAVISGVCVLFGGIGILLWAILSGSPAVSNANIRNSNEGDSLRNASVKTSSPPPKSVSPEMIYISGGDFMMGRNNGQSEAEAPAHKVSIKPFFVDIYEITNEQYAEFVKATNHRLPADWQNGSFPPGEARFPVVGVSWEDADAYAKWTGKRLPTEEEWEFAARSADNNLYPWGNVWSAGNANAHGAKKKFTEVGSFNPSPLGIYDLVGNVWEWTASDFKAYPGGQLPADFAGKTNLKTIRGGSFEATKDYATATYRIGWAATGADNYSRTGFRLVKDVEK